MKKMLIVSYYFPPYGGVGSVRITKLVKYLKRFGWDVTVLTVDENYYSQNELDYKKLKDIPIDVKIIKTKKLPVFTKLKDEGLYWTFNLFVSLVKELNKKKYDYVFYTGDPFFQWIIAPLIKTVSKIPYILDFRDPWMLTPYNSSKIRRRVLGFIEPNIIKSAELILNVTSNATQMYQDYYSDVDINKFITVPNGYDSEDFESIPSLELKIKEGIRFVYTGKFGEFRNPIPFLKSILQFNKQSEKKCIFYHIGTNEQIIDEFIQNNPEVKPYIIQTGFLPYENALSYIKMSNVALIVSGGHPYEPTTKVYDYLALNKKILCINDIKFGYLYDLLESNPNSVYVLNNEKDILEGISRLNNNNQTGSIDSNDFDRKIIFKKFSDLL